MLSTNLNHGEAKAAVEEFTNELQSKIVPIMSKEMLCWCHGG